MKDPLSECNFGEAFLEVKTKSLRVRIQYSHDARTFQEGPRLRLLLQEGSLHTVLGEKAGRHTAIYSAPSGPGVLYRIHSPFEVSTP